MGEMTIAICKKQGLIPQGETTKVKCSNVTLNMTIVKTTDLYTSFILFILFFGYTWWCSWFTPGSSLRVHCWR